MAEDASTIVVKSLNEDLGAEGSRREPDTPKGLQRVASLGKSLKNILPYERIQSVKSKVFSKVNSADVVVEEDQPTRGSSGVLTGLMWKNWLIKKKRWKTSLLEVLVPLFFVILLASLKTLTVLTLVDTGWSTDEAQYCPYTDKSATSILAPVSCNLPFNAFYRTAGSFQQIESFISRENRSLFLTYDSENERETVFDFISWATEIGTAESGPISGFVNMTTIYEDGSSDALIAYAKSADYGKPFTKEAPEIVVGLSFNTMDFENANFDYTLRINSSFAHNGIKVTDADNPATEPLERSIDYDDGSPNVEYLQSGFVAMQVFVDSYIIHRSNEFFNFTNEEDFENEEEFRRARELFEPANVASIAFPVFEYTQDIFFVVIAELFPLIFVITYLSPASQIVAVIVLEKEVRAREMLRLMGVPDYMVILSWYLTYAIYFFLIGVLIAGLGASVFPETTAAAGGFSWVLVCIFFLFGMATTAFAFVVSTFFQTAFNGIVACLMVFLMLFFTFYSFDGTSGETSGPPPFGAFLIPQVTFGFIMKTLTAFEGSAIGLSWELTGFVIDGFSVLDGFWYLTLDFLYLTALGFYFNAVIPGEFGTPLPFYFPLQRSFYRKIYDDYMLRREARKANFDAKKLHTTGIALDTKFANLEVLSGETVEEVTYNMKQQVKNKVGIQIRGLTKRFQTPDGIKTAVDNFSLDVFEGQILVLLGHNGAGKTTLLSILSGSLTPSEGDALIYGKLITQDITAIRNQLGFCPQKDVLYPSLTVNEHLRFYGKLKGLSGSALDEAVKTSVENVGLTEKVHVRSKSLSGGMKRKLSLAISLLGDSKVIFVDEPTSGVDTFSRRSIWQSIQNCREGRVIILTTHFMDEADILSDRLAIMAEGKLQCCGSSMFLKQLYGAGYQLTCVRVSSNEIAKEVQDTTEIVLDTIPGASVVSDIGTELSFYLPLKETKLFSKLFKELDTLIERKEININAYGVSVTTMEEVFLKAGQSEDLLEGAKEIHRQNSIRSFASLKGKNIEKKTELPEAKPASSSGTSKKSLPLLMAVFNSIFLRQFYALFLKRVNYARRDSYSFLCNTLVPVSIFTVGLLVLKLVPLLEDEPPLVLSVEDWNPNFPLRQRAIVSVSEFSENGDLLSPEDSIVFSQEHFEQFVLKDADIDGEIPLVERTVFDRLYENGESLDCTASFRCPTGFPSLLGDTVLDFGEAIIRDRGAENRNGATQYIAGFTQPRNARVRDNSCFTTDIDVNADSLDIELSYSSEICSRRNNECLYIQGELLGFEQCLPAGCLSNVNVDTLIGFRADITDDGVDESDIEDIERVLNETNAAFFTCQGAFCNIGPVSLLDGNLCRGSPAGSGLPEDNPNCIADGLTQLEVVLEVEEDGSLDVDLPPVFGANYCDSRQVDAPETEIDVESGRICELSNVSQVTDSLDILVDILTSNITIGTSFDSDSLTCIDETILDDGESCRLSTFTLGNISVCVPANCLSEVDQELIISDLVGTAFEPFVSHFLFGPNSTQIECAASANECSATLDLLSVRDLVNVAQELNLTDVTFIEDILTLFEGVDFSFDIPTSSSLTVVTSGRALQETAICGESTEGECQVSQVGTVCINATCTEEFEQALIDLFGQGIGSALGFVPDVLDSVPCSNLTALAELNCSDTFSASNVDELADTIITDPELLLDFFNINITEEQVGLLVQAATLFIIDLQDGVELNEALQNLIDELIAAGIPGAEDLSVEQLEAIVLQVEQVIQILLVIQENPELVSIFLAQVFNGLPSSVVTCSDPNSQCVLLELSGGILGNSAACFAAGCEQESLDDSSTTDVIEGLGTGLFSETGTYLCNSTLCNFGCYSPSNCEADELTPVETFFNETDDSVSYVDDDEICFVQPNLRYGYTLLVNTTALHAIPIGVNEINQALLRSSLTNASIGNILPSITVTNHPLPRTSQDQQILQAIIAFITAIFALLAFAFIPGPMISYAVMEKEESVQIKHLQFVSGTSIGAYWLASYAFDLVVFLVPCSLALMLIQLFEITSFTENGAFEVVAVVFFGYGLAVIPFAYLVSHLFSDHTNALIGIIIINCITGVTLMIASFAMDQIPQTEDLNPKLKFFYRFFPGFCLGDSLLQVATTSLILGILGPGQGIPGLFDFDVSGANIMYLYTEGFFFLFLVIVVEYAKTNLGRIERAKSVVRTFYAKARSALEHDAAEMNILEEKPTDEKANEEVIDNDVAAEEELVASRVNIDTEVVRMEKLRKVYPGGKVAVKGVSLGIPEGMCFGYLGINGAGKTTTLKCLTGDVFPTGGRASIKGYDIVTNQHNVRKNIGYCSQFSSILGLLTVREHLELFCRIKYHTLSFSAESDSSTDLIEHNVQKLLKRLSLKPFENKLSKSLSGGNKRKLSVAIAMVGSPSVMLLDEPSTGMDVASRRFMWDVIENMVAGKHDGKKTSVILTTHSMEECQALCSRVGIMVGGRLRCLGGIQHLKSKFGNGFTIETKLDFVRKSEVASLLDKVDGHLNTEACIPINNLLATCKQLGGEDIFGILAKNTRGSAWAILQKLRESSTTEEKAYNIDGEVFVEWFLQQQRLATLTTFLEKSFPNNVLELVEGHEYHIVFKLNKNSENKVPIMLGDLFEVLEENKTKMQVSEYSVSQTTLEQIFNGFASQQEEEKGRARGMADAEEEVESLTQKEKEIREILQGQLEPQGEGLDANI
eukprot:maker-scaffold_6-snap-gene-12.1-mRNA-1 protein AED:0.16 eAED:0.16 QI:0/0/0/1/1/1/3/0/2699